MVFAAWYCMPCGRTLHCGRHWAGRIAPSGAAERAWVGQQQQWAGSRWSLRPRVITGVALNCGDDGHLKGCAGGVWLQNQCVPQVLPA
jgi:hypothetical protein